MNTTKISDTEIEITKPVAPIVTKYERGFIEKQMETIQAQKDRDNALRDAELAECETILLEMDRLGVVAKVESVENVEVLP